MHDLLFAAGLQDLVLLPESTAYIDRQASYWASNAPLQPICIVQPRTTEQVSLVVKALAKAKGPLALRSGGHTQWPGSNDVHEGVTIDLGQMTDVTFDKQSKLASIQPGSRWANVYQELLKDQVCVTGGRDGNVGIGGFLTGGGNSFFAGLHGLGCDNVANFEVVLASGEIINANSSSHADLWTALKGGSGNFGIVTRFDMYTFPAHNLWGGIRAAMRSEGDGLAQMMVDFTERNHKDPQAAFMLGYDFNPTAAPFVFVTHMIVNTNGKADGSTFEKIQKVPAVLEDIKERSMAEMAASYSLPSGRQYVYP
jgi:FAD/FMN-containing dehydrogenase